MRLLIHSAMVNEYSMSSMVAQYAKSLREEREAAAAEANSAQRIEAPAQQISDSSRKRASPPKETTEGTPKWKKLRPSTPQGESAGS